MALRFEKYGRFWAVYESDELLCVAVYKKGASAVIKRIEHAMRVKRPTTKGSRNRVTRLHNVEGNSSGSQDKR